MESQELRIFVEVAYQGSISKAANQLGYVQSNITAHIKQLEAELATPLFIRTAKGVQLSKAGERLLPQAQQIIALLDACERSFMETESHLRIGTTQSIARSILPTCILELQTQFPKMRFDIVTLNQETMEEDLLKGTLDCILSNRSLVFHHANRIFQQSEQLYLVAPKSCQTLEEARNLPLVVNEIETCPYRALLMNWNPKATSHMVSFDTVDAMLAYIAQGGGITLLANGVVQNREEFQLFYLEELQQTSIQLWIKETKDIEFFQPLVRCLTTVMKN